MVIADLLDPLVGELEHFGAERLDHGSAAIERAVEQGLGHASTVVANERAEVASTVVRHRELEPIQPTDGVDTLVPPALTIDHDWVRVKTCHHRFEVVAVEGVEVASDDVLFASRHVSFLLRAVRSSSSMKARALAVTRRASW